MEIARAELLECLKKVQPALADEVKPLVPVLTHLCFDGKYVTAYDNMVAMRTSCKLEFKGALPGSLLLSMLGASSVANATLEATDTEVRLKLGRAKLKLASLPTEDFLFRKPDCTNATELLLDSKLMIALNVALRSASPAMEDTSKCGVTWAFDDKVLTLYATDSKTLMCCELATGVSGLEGKSFITPERFVRLVLRVGADKLLITDQGDVVATGGGVTVYGRVLPAAAEQYDAVFAQCKLEEVPKADVPVTLTRCLERASLVSKELVTLSYESGKLVIHSTSPIGDLVDSVKIDLGDDKVEVVTCPESIIKFLDIAKQIGINSQSIVLEGEGFQVLVAVLSPAEAKATEAKAKEVADVD